MIPSSRNTFNQHFTIAGHQNYLKALEGNFPGAIQFRVAETPLFIDKKFKEKVLNVGEYILDFILSPNFKKLTQSSIPEILSIPNESNYPACIVMDFAIAENKLGSIVPMLIELQGFPSLFAYELFQDKILKEQYPFLQSYSPYLNNQNCDTYTKQLGDLIKGVDQKHTILLEIEPTKQKTKIDFLYTQQLFGIPIVCLSEIYKENGAIYYQKEGKAFKVERIYNRIVFDELAQSSDTFKNKFKLFNEVENIEWVTHPNHFYRISKFMLPFLNHPMVPKSYLLSKINIKEIDLDAFIVKPLFSYGGQGVIIDLNLAILEKIKNPEAWILQEKVKYSPTIHTPSGPSTAELRIFYFWDLDLKKYVPTCNLARISKGKLIGVSYNDTATWVGGTIAYFE